MSEATPRQMPAIEGPEAADAKRGSSPRYGRIISLHSMPKELILLKDITFYLLLIEGCATSLCSPILGRIWEDELMQMWCFAPPGKHLTHPGALLWGTSLFSPSHGYLIPEKFAANATQGVSAGHSARGESFLGRAGSHQNLDAAQGVPSEPSKLLWAAST